MSNPFHLHAGRLPMFVLSLGVLLLSPLQLSPTIAAEPTTPTPQQDTPRSQPSITPPETLPASPQTPPQPTSEERRDDRVYISDIFPEYCRSYFSRRDWISLIEYHAGMSRCLYGPDRWR